MRSILELVNAIMALVGFFDPNNEKDVGLRISLFVNFALVFLLAILSVKAEPYVIECGVNKATIQSIEKILKEEREVSAKRLLRIEMLEERLNTIFELNIGKK